jgi:alkylmercury lyase
MVTVSLLYSNDLVTTTDEGVPEERSTEMAASASSTVVERVWQRFQEVGFTPDFGPEGSRLLIAMYRRLAAEGRPINPDEVADLAAQNDVSPDAARELVEHTAERDDDGSVRGIVGLSLNEHPHVFRVNGQELRNWCALDPLLIVPTMTEEVELESLDPAMGASVRATVAPDGLRGCEPAEAMVSIVIPEPGATDSVEAVWMMFCHQVHFFASRGSGERFFEQKEMEVYFLTLDEAFELGRLAFAPVYEQL